jgi:hypothetical protein
MILDRSGPKCLCPSAASRRPGPSIIRPTPAADALCPSRYAPNALAKTMPERPFRWLRGWLDRNSAPGNFLPFARNEPSVPRLPHQRGTKRMVPAMLNDPPAYEPSAWPPLVELIGRGLRKTYRPPEELPPAWLTMLGRLETKLEIPVHDIKGEFEILT